MSIATANSLNEAALAKYAAIDADTRLTPAAKRQDKLKVWAALDTSLRALRAQDQAAANKRRDDLERQLFGITPGSDIVAYRDAERFAEKIETEAEAARVMDSARRAGDDQLTRAVAATAFRSGWTQLQQAYTTEVRPEDADAAAEYSNLNANSATGAALIQDWAFIPVTPPGVTHVGREPRPDELRTAAQDLGIPTTPDDPIAGQSLLHSIANTRSANAYGNDTGMTTGDAA